MTTPTKPAGTNRGLFRGVATLLFGLLLATSARADRTFETWFQKYDPMLSSSPGVNAIAIDRFGNVAITGYKYTGHRIYYTAKYDGLSGALIWEQEFDPGADAEARSVAMDSAGNVIVTGGATFNTTQEDIYTIKYASAFPGNEIWHKQYDSGNQTLDEGVKVAVDSSDNVIFTGKSVGSGTDYDIYTAKYTAGGTFVWGKRYNSPSNRPDEPVDLAIDSSGNAVVAGIADESSNTLFVTIRYTAANGTPDLTKTFQSPGSPSYYGARAVTVDKDDNIITTGLATLASGHALQTIKYNGAIPAAAPIWSKTFPLNVADTNDPADVATDSAGNVIVAGTSRVDGQTVAIQTIKFDAANGSILKNILSPAPGGTDRLTAMSVDGLDNVILTGSSLSEDQDVDFYTAKYSTNGDTIFERRFDDGNDGGSDTPAALAVGIGGDFAITGPCKKTDASTFEIITIRYGHTFLSTGDLITANGIPEGAKIATIFPPTVSDSGKVAAKVTLAAGKKRIGAILTAASGSGIQVPVYQGGASGISNANFASFSDPILTPNGNIAFIGKVSGSGVRPSESVGVWTDAVGNVGLQNILRVGQQVFGLSQGVLLQSVSNISARNGQIVALIKVKGTDVTKANSTVLYCRNIFGGYQLLRTGDPITVDSIDTTIKSFTVFTPAKGSAGHGRYHGDGTTIIRVTLADKRSLILTDTIFGTLTQRLFTNGDAGVVNSGAKWKSFGLPAIDTNGARFVTIGTITGDGVTKANDTAIVYHNGSNLFKMAREGDDVTNMTGVQYASFLDPVISPTGLVSYIGTMKGNVTASKKTGLWYGIPGINILIAQTGTAAPDAAGNDTGAKFTSFTSLANPGGARPIFTAKVTGKNITGLWALDANGIVRKLIQNGDPVGTTSVKKFSVLQPTSGSLGVTRSFNGNGTVTALVSFGDKSTGVVQIAIP